MAVACSTPPKPPRTVGCQYLYFCTSKASKVACSPPPKPPRTVTMRSDEYPMIVLRSVSTKLRTLFKLSIVELEEVISISNPTYTPSYGSAVLASFTRCASRIRQHASAYVSIREHTHTCASRTPVKVPWSVTPPRHCTAMAPLSDVAYV